ncbi:MAG: hypothetical protein QXM75_04005, partial [Candidatus Diapherotrites archaeon]
MQLEPCKKNENLCEDKKLKFTGSWFIDAGIIGFVNLMEKVYDWDLEELQKRISNEPENVYYLYFPLAYLFYHSEMKENYGKLQKGDEKRSEIDKLKKEWSENKREFQANVSKIACSYRCGEDEIKNIFPRFSLK